MYRKVGNPKPYKTWLLLQSAFVLVSILAGTIEAQTKPSISGHIKDERGANVSGASVSARTRGGLERVTVTDAAGQFAFPELASGSYLIEAKAQGFVSSTKEIRLDGGSSEPIDIVLKVAGISESVVVTAAGTPQRADELSKAVTVVDNEEIEARHEITLTEALRGVPGVRVQQQGSQGELTSLRLRGQRNFDTAILLDGLRIRDASDPNGSAFVLMADLLPVDLDRVEVLRGSGSSIYGTNAIGGVINLVQSTGNGTPHFEAGWEGGSF